MNKDAKNTRIAIMDSAQDLILDHGFGGTTVDAVIEKAGVSKGAFFHYFSSKDELGKALVKRYADADAEHLEKTLKKAEGLADDPLRQLLIFIKLFEQEMDELEEPYPGCLYASYLSQAELFDKNVRELIRESMLLWRIRIKEKLDQIITDHPPAKDIDLESLADMLLVIFEGAFVLSQSIQDPKTVSRQLSHYHSYLKLLFERS